MGKLDNGIDLTAFTAETRQNKRNVGTISPSTGSGSPFLIPKTGFLQKVWILADINVTVTLGGGTAVVDPINDIYGLLGRITVSLGGTKTTFNTSGVGARMIQNISKDGFIPENSGYGTPPAHAARVHAAGYGAGAQNWRFALPIPIAPNDIEMVGGFLNMFEAIHAYLTLTMNPLYSLVPGTSPTLVTGAATVTLNSGNYNIAVESFELPQKESAYPPMNMLHSIIEQNVPLTAVGDLAITHPVSNIYMQLLYQVVHNGAANSLFVDALKFVGRRALVWYDMSNQYLLADQRQRYGHDLPPGQFVLDLFHQGEANLGGFRDMLDGKAVSELQTILTIGSGATIGSNAFVRVIQRQLEPVVS